MAARCRMSGYAPQGDSAPCEVKNAMAGVVQRTDRPVHARPTLTADREPTLFELPVPGDVRRRLALGWLLLGLGALLASGLFAVLLVAARTPLVMNVWPWKDFFGSALVVHVNLSVLVWFLAFGGVLWTLNSTPRWLGLGRVALAAAALGAATMTVAPFTGEGQPLMSNYIPVLRQPVFLAGLAVLALGAAALVLRAMSTIPPVGPRMAGAGALRFGLNAAAVSAALALIAFAWTYVTLPAGVVGNVYYELLFWGGGHVLQFTWTLLLLVAWLWLANAAGLPLRLSPRVALVFFGLGLVTVFFAPLIYYAYPVTSVEHIKLFTWLMQYGGSLATLPLGAAVLYALLAPGARPAAAAGGAAAAAAQAALIASVVLFGVGGSIGYLIQGSNVTVPAHYHGCIVGITLAFMGLTYHLMPRLGARAVEPRWASIQLWLYGGGQLLHVMGLLWSGGYGVARKTAGAAQALDSIERIAGMTLMGLGGLVAIAGGGLFLVLVLRALAPRRRGSGDARPVLTACGLSQKG